MDQRTVDISPDGLKYTFPEGAAPPGADSFALAAFAAEAVGSRAGRVCDLGAGAGLISLLLVKRCPGIFADGVERDGGAAETFEKNAAQLPGAKLWAIRGDIRDIEELLPRGAYDFTVSNPPYFPRGGGRVSARSGSARHALCCDIRDVCRAAGYLLKERGRFFVCFRPERLCELLDAARKERLEPKRLRFVCHNSSSAPSILLLECVKGARPGLAVLRNLYLYKSNGKPTAESDRIYGYD